MRSLVVSLACACVSLRKSQTDLGEETRRLLARFAVVTGRGEASDFALRAEAG